MPMAASSPALAVLPYLAVAYLYKRSNWLWRLLIRRLGEQGGQSVIISVSSNVCRNESSSPSSACATARTDCETRVSCPITNCSLSQRFRTVVRFRSSQATACLRGSFLRSFGRSPAFK